MKLQGPAGNSGLSYGADTFEPDADGCVEVPDEIVAIAMAHGFVQADVEISAQADELDKLAAEVEHTVDDVNA